jgi:hypothetical protein
MALKRHLIQVSAVIAVGAALGVATTGISSAVATAAPTHAAITLSNAGCGLADGNGNAVFVDSAHSVITSSGNLMQHCTAQVAPSSGGTAVHYDFNSTGAMCSTAFGPTSTWQETVSASGQATLSCHV